MAKFLEYVNPNRRAVTIDTGHIARKRVGLNPLGGIGLPQNYGAIRMEEKTAEQFIKTGILTLRNPGHVITGHVFDLERAINDGHDRIESKGLGRR